MYVISNSKTSKSEIDFELKKIARKFGRIIMLLRILHIFNNSEANYSVPRLLGLCICHLPMAFLFNYLISIPSGG